MLELLLLVCSVNLILTSTLIYKLSARRVAPDVTPDVTETVHYETPDATADNTEIEASVDSHELTEYELYRLEQEAEFDLRIARMKEQLASQLPEKRMRGTQAETLHPHVKNLPHNTIFDLYNDLPDVEISD